MILKVHRLRFEGGQIIILWDFLRIACTRNC